jgi:hypothetical protein
MAKERAINNANWQSSLDGRMASDDVCIETAVHKDGSAELQFEFDAQESAIIILTEKQKEQLIRKLQASNKSEWED